MKIDAAYAQIYYPAEVRAGQRSMSYQRPSQENQICCFEMIDSGNFSAIGNEKPMAIGQPQDVGYCYHDRHFMDFTSTCRRHHSFSAVNNIDSAAVEDSFSSFTGLVKSEIDTIPGSNALSAIETDIRNFEISVKAALDNFTDDLMTLVQNQTELFDQAYTELVSAISGYFDRHGSDSASELSDIENTGDAGESATTNARSFNFEEFEIKFRETFMTALDELLKSLKEATYIRNDAVAEGSGQGHVGNSGNYAQLMESTHSSNDESDHGTFAISI
jgi:hypothetical protein